MTNHLVDRIGIERVDDGDVEVGVAVHGEAVGQRRVGAGMHGGACAGDCGEGRVAKLSTAPLARLRTQLCGCRRCRGCCCCRWRGRWVAAGPRRGWGRVGRCIAGVRPSVDAQSGDGGDMACGVHLAHAVVLRVGDVEIAKRVEGDVGGDVQGGGCGHAGVPIESARACAVAGEARGCIQQRGKLAARAQRGQADRCCEEKNEGPGECSTQTGGVHYGRTPGKRSPFRYICTDLSECRVWRVGNCCHSAHFQHYRFGLDGRTRKSPAATGILVIGWRRYRLSTSGYPLGISGPGAMVPDLRAVILTVALNNGKGKRKAQVFCLNAEK